MLLHLEKVTCVVYGLYDGMQQQLIMPSPHTQKLPPNLHVQCGAAFTRRMVFFEAAGLRRHWRVCPYRVLDFGVFRQGNRRYADQRARCFRVRRVPPRATSTFVAARLLLVCLNNSTLAEVSKFLTLLVVDAGGRQKFTLLPPRRHASVSTLRVPCSSDRILFIAIFPRMYHTEPHIMLMIFSMRLCTSPCLMIFFTTDSANYAPIAGTGGMGVVELCKVRSGFLGRRCSRAKRDQARSTGGCGWRRE